MNDPFKKAMRPMSNPVDAYRKTDVMTANRETILLMLYAGAIRFLKQAIEYFEKGQIEERTKLVNRTQEIITELRSTLNFEAGGEIATRLEGLYAFINQRLTVANLENKVEPIQEALSILKTLNEAWEVAVDNVRKEKAKETEQK